MARDCARPEECPTDCPIAEAYAAQVRELEDAFLAITTYYAGLPVKYQSVEHKEAMKRRDAILQARDTGGGRP